MQKNSIDRIAIPLTLSALAIVFAGIFYRVSGTDGLLMYLFGVPFPLLLLWWSRNVKTLDDRYPSAPKPKADSRTLAASRPRPVPSQA